LNDLEVFIIFNPNNEFITTFPYRIHRAIASGSESVQENWRIFKINEYYDSVYNKGQIIQLDTDGKALLIEHEGALFVAQHTTELKFANGIISSLGDADIFSITPVEIIPTGSGYVGNQSKFASIRTKHGNIIIDKLQGKIFLYNDMQVQEISMVGLKEWFENNTDYASLNAADEGYIFDDDTDVQFDNDNYMIYIEGTALDEIHNTRDNPFNEFGLMSTFDNKNERIIITKREKYASGVDNSWTLSYYPLLKAWVSRHSYKPNFMMFNRNGSYVIKNDFDTTQYSLFRMNKGEYGNYYGTVIPEASYIDVVFNEPKDIDKNFMALVWDTIVTDADGIIKYSETFDKAVVYNFNRHSGEVELVLQTFTAGNVRKTGGTWKFNDFRDLLENKEVEVVNPLDVEELQFTNIEVANIATDWWKKNIFVDTFIVVRFIFNNEDNKNIQINDVRTHALPVKR